MGFRIVVASVVMATIVGFLADQSSDKELDGKHIVQYNCNMLLGGWHPDVPPEVIKQCRIPKKDRNDNRN